MTRSVPRNEIGIPTVTQNASRRRRKRERRVSTRARPTIPVPEEQREAAPEVRRPVLPGRDLDPRREPGPEGLDVPVHRARHPERALAPDPEDLDRDRGPAVEPAVALLLREPVHHPGHVPHPQAGPVGPRPHGDLRHVVAGLHAPPRAEEHLAAGSPDRAARELDRARPDRPDDLVEGQIEALQVDLPDVDRDLEGAGAGHRDLGDPREARDLVPDLLGQAAQGALSHVATDRDVDHRPAVPSLLDQGLLGVGGEGVRSHRRGTRPRRGASGRRRPRAPRS